MGLVHTPTPGPERKQLVHTWQEQQRMVADMFAGIQVEGE